MIKERIPISGDLKSKVKQLMEYAGWQEGRKVDISIAEKYYADHGVPMMKTTQRFYRKYFGLCCEWYLEQKKLNWAADFQFALFPYLVNGIKNHLEEAYFRDMSGCELAEIEQAVGEKCQPRRPDVRALAQEQYEMRFPPRHLEDDEFNFFDEESFIE